MQDKLDSAGQKRVKGQGKVISARKRVLERLLGPVKSGKTEQKFAAPPI